MENDELKAEETQEEQGKEEPVKKWASWDNPLLTPEGWQEVRRAVEAGLSMPEAAQKFGVTHEAVKQRSFREEWLTEKRIQKLAAEAMARKYENVKQSPSVTQPEKGQNSGEEANSSRQSALEIVATTLEGHRSRTMLKLAKLAEKGVERAIDANLTIENWQDAKIAADIAMKLHQVGPESVQVNICNAFADMGEGAVVETDAEIVGEDERGDGGRDSYFVD